MKNETTFHNFVKSYLVTAAWVTCESDTECHTFTDEAKMTACNDCKKFIDKVFAEFSKEDAEDILNKEGSDLQHIAAHDFFLTRNHHGVGFWDREDIYGVENAKKLTDISHEFGETDCYHVGNKRSKLTFN